MRDSGRSTRWRSPWTAPTWTRCCADPDVLGVSVDAPVSSASSKTSQQTTSLTAVTKTESSTLTHKTWLSSHLATTLGVDALVIDGELVDGKKVGVAIIDSGIAPTGDYGIAAFVDFVNGRTDGPYDDFGHGTHVAGLIASSGVALQRRVSRRGAGRRLIGLKVLDAHGSGLTSTVLAALDYAIVNKAKLGIDVLNLSLGHVIDEPAATDPLVQAVERATAAGLVVVVSAGNYGTNPDTGVTGYAGITSPGNAPSAITVGALDTKLTLTRTDDEVTAYSSRGPTWYDGLAKPDLVAPGHHLTSDVMTTSTLAVELAARYTSATNSRTRTPAGSCGSAARAWRPR